MKMNLLVKEDPELGYAYFCPACKRFLCSTAESCLFCGQALDWEAEKAAYSGNVKWPSAKELELLCRRKPEEGMT